MKTIDVTPTFAASASMMILVLESGSEEGKQFARDEIARWGRMLDRLVAERRSHAAQLRTIYADSVMAATRGECDGVLSDAYLQQIENIIGELEQ